MPATGLAVSVAMRSWQTTLVTGGRSTSFRTGCCITRRTEKGEGMEGENGEGKEGEGEERKGEARVRS